MLMLTNMYFGLCLVQGPGFHWSSMFEGQSRFFLGFECHLPPPVQSLFWLLADSVLFLTAALYLDAVLPGPHGSPSHPLFFLGCSYQAKANRAGTAPLLPPASSHKAVSEANDNSVSAGSGHEDAGVQAETALVDECVRQRMIARQAMLSGAVQSTAVGAAAASPDVIQSSQVPLLLTSPSDPGSLKSTTSRSNLESNASGVAVGGVGGAAVGVRDASSPPAEISSASGIAAAHSSGTAATTEDVVVCISHLRVVYRRGIRAFLHGLGWELLSLNCYCRRKHSSGSRWLAKTVSCLYRRQPTGTAAAASVRWTDHNKLHQYTRLGGASSEERGQMQRDVHNHSSTTAGNGEAAASAASYLSSLPGEVVAVRDLSLTVRRGECLALLGHNGAGKTTTISVLTGLFSSDGGSAEVCGYDVATEMPQVQQLVGVCQQHDILWPQLTAHETMALFAAIKGVPRAEREAEVRRVLGQVRLLSVAHKPVGTFSGGMKRRVSVAIAALGSPKVIYLDEP